jgi:uncharacterized membrane protein YfcA
MEEKKKIITNEWIKDELIKEIFSWFIVWLALYLLISKYYDENE